MDANLITAVKSSKPGPTGLANSTENVWHRSAPEAVRKAFRSGSDSEGWMQWLKHLGERDGPPSPLAAKRSPLAWALPDAAHDGDTPKTLERIARLGWRGRRTGPSAEKLALEWLATAAGSAASAEYALEAVAWCWALPQVAAALPSDAWWDLLDHLLQAVAEADEIELTGRPLVHQLLAGELPLVLSCLFPEIGPCRKLASKSRRALSTGLVDLLDGEGLPHARHLGLLRPLLACWTRCRAVADHASVRCWTDAAQTQYEWLVRQALRLTRHDGSPAFSRDGADRGCRELFDAALRLGGNENDEQIAAMALPRRSKVTQRPHAEAGLPDPANHSEWAATGMLRTGWSPNDPRLTVAYPNQSVDVELETRKHVLCSGPWELEVRCHGRLQQPTSDWQEVCWTSDDDVDYLELEIELTGGLRVQRHVLLAREDRFLFLADAILGEQPADLDYRGCLPLSQGITFQPAGETREGYLGGRSRLALALPLALPEWRADDRVGSLTQTDRGLELCQRSRGRSMFGPLFFDLQPRRMGRSFTWRRLTVAENRQVQPDDASVGYRVMVGGRQWLIYRSLGPVGNRTLLGHNLTGELLVARFDRDGEVSTLLEIEAE
jgi:hypothetical protein